MSHLLTRACPICHGHKGTILKNIQMCHLEGSPLPTTYPVVSCETCGFTFADVEATQQVYNEYYTNYNIHSEDSAVKDFQFRSGFENMYELMKNYISLNAKILDVGCGNGDFLRYLQKKGYNHLYGLDPSSEAITRLIKHGGGVQGGITGIVGNVFDDIYDPYRHFFDLVISTAVIEHIYDLQGYLERIRFFMKPSHSYFLVDAPAVEGMPQYLYPVPAYFNHEHINYFSIVSLDNLLGEFQLFRINPNVYFEEVGELALNGLYQLEEKESRLTFDTSSSQSIQEYFTKLSDHKKASLESVLQTHKHVIIWGAGSYTMQILSEYPDLIGHVVCFIDNNTTKCGKSILGKPIYLPEFLLQQENYYPIFIFSMKNSNDIQQQIIKMGVPNEIYPM